MAELTDTRQPPARPLREPARAPTLNASHYHTCSECDVTLICCCPDKRQVDRLTGKPRRLLCVRCGEIELGAGGRGQPRAGGKETHDEAIKRVRTITGT